MKYIIIFLVFMFYSCSSLDMSFDYGQHRAEQYLSSTSNKDNPLSGNRIIVLQESLNVLNTYIYNYKRMNSVGFELMVPRISNKMSTDFYKPLVDDFLIKEHKQLLTTYNLNPYGENYYFHLCSLRDGILVIVLSESHKLLHEIPNTVKSINDEMDSNE